ncbi:MAG: 2-C-methyl-D-erythritol 4-phosphate cytidylyltransferase [Deltaproteobacteria bacterium]|jgi:2-C-methyl-D-erythritol 4-phosphate cytidylyltransferase/2-C-methyl-D-erythritol 2,4-cyclodiphosphate synthase|nr:2-C-methyl-D-erythritol 4-phosphate cytidylyltransferase [Deltaproteobacteria bacterium]
MKKNAPPPRAVRPWAIVLAAGSGSRMAAAGLARPKQFLEYQGLPLYWHGAAMFSRCARVAGVIFVFPEDRLAEEELRIRQLDGQTPRAGAAFPNVPTSLGLPWKAVAGGPLRQDSVFNALKALPANCEFVLLHDAARPFASAGLIGRLIDALEQGPAGVVPGLPVTDTMKHALNGKVVATLDRENLYAVQTPQAFRLDALRAAHESARAEGWTATDDAALLERLGHEVHIIPGEAANRKITLPEDVNLLRPPQPFMCVGYGYDVHRYGSGRPMRLGGVSIPDAPEVLAHSDGDALLHALMDAILGCACLGDIGRLFPDDDPKLENIHSAILLDETLRIAAAAGVELMQADCTIIAQIPRIAPHSQAIRRNLSRLLGLDERRVNVKATTEEGLGFTGAREGIKAVALVGALRNDSIV